jgi:hypothetical protein
LRFLDFALTVSLVQMAGCLGEPQAEVWVDEDEQLRMHTVVETSDQAVKLEPVEALDRVLKLKADSYHVLLREASRLVPPALLGREWGEVQRLMQNHSFVSVEAWDNGSAANAYWLLKRKAVTFSNGYSLDLYALIQARNLDEPNYPLRLDGLCRADVALVAAINAPYAQVIAEERYPKGSVLEVILNHMKVREVGETWPLLSKIYVNYGYLYDRWRGYNPSGFEVQVEFIVSTQEEIAQKKMTFTVASGLDPLRSLDGKKAVLDGFESQDTLGKIRECGGLEAWHGEPETIAALKLKYLKSK